MLSLKYLTQLYFWISANSLCWNLYKNIPRFVICWEEITHSADHELLYTAHFTVWQFCSGTRNGPFESCWKCFIHIPHQGNGSPVFSTYSAVHDTHSPLHWSYQISSAKFSDFHFGNFSIFKIFQFPFSSLPLLISQISLKILSKSDFLNNVISSRELWTEGQYTDRNTDQLDSSKRNTGDLLERTLQQQKSNKKSPTLGIYI